MAKRKVATRPSDRLFVDEQSSLFEKSYQEEVEALRRQPVECLGMTFPNDEERPVYFPEKLREKLEEVNV